MYKFLKLYTFISLGYIYIGYELLDCLELYCIHLSKAAKLFYIHTDNTGGSYICR